MRVDPLQILTKLAAVQKIPTRRVTPPCEGLEEFGNGQRRLFFFLKKKKKKNKFLPSREEI